MTYEKLKILAEIRDEFISKTWSNKGPCLVPKKESLTLNSTNLTSHENDYCRCDMKVSFDAGVAEMKKRAQRLIDCLEGVMSCDEEQWTLEQERIGNKAICIMALADYKSLDI